MTANQPTNEPSSQPSNQPGDSTHHTAWQPPHVPAPAAPEPHRKSWFARHKIITGLAAVVLVGAGIQAANGGSTTTPTATADSTTTTGQAPAAPDAPEDAPEDAEPAAPAAAKVGQKVRDGQFEFTVTKVRTGVATVGDRYLNERAQGQYVLVDITVTNIGDQAQLLSDSSQKLSDDRGRQFSTDTTAAIYLKDNKVFLNEINPGNSLKGTLVFDMPKGAKPVTLELHDSPFSDGVSVSIA